MPYKEVVWGWREIASWAPYFLSSFVRTGKEQPKYEKQEKNNKQTNTRQIKEALKI